MSAGIGRIGVIAGPGLIRLRHDPSMVEFGTRSKPVPIQRELFEQVDSFAIRENGQLTCRWRRSRAIKGSGVDRHRPEQKKAASRWGMRPKG